MEIGDKSVGKFLKAVWVAGFFRYMGAPFPL
jgi:hypothetical protein